MKPYSRKGSPMEMKVVDKCFNGHYGYRIFGTRCPGCCPDGRKQFTAIAGVPEDPDAGEEIDVWARSVEEAQHIAEAALEKDYEEDAFISEIGPMFGTASGAILFFG